MDRSSPVASRPPEREVAGCPHVRTSAPCAVWRSVSAMPSRSPAVEAFGRVLTAMVTPFTADGALDLDAAQRLAAHLVDAGQRRPGGQRDHRGVAHHDRRREGAARPRRRRGGRRPGPRRRRGRHQRHAPHDRAGARGREGRRPRAAASSRRTTTSRRRQGLPATSAPSPTPPTCRSCSTTSPAAPARRSRPRRWCGSPSTRGSSPSRTPRATSRAGSEVMAAHRPGLLLRRRRAQPALARHRRRRRRQRGRPRRRRALRRDGRGPSTAGISRRAIRIHRELLPVVRAIMTQHPGRDHGQGRAARCWA